MKIPAFVIFALLSSYHLGSAGTIRGYVVDVNGHRAAHARIEAWHDVPTDQRPPRHPTLISKATADRNGDFVITVAPSVNVLIATFKRQAGNIDIPSSEPFRIQLRRVRSRHDI